MEKIKKLNFKSIIFLFIISFLVIFFFSIGTSPFYENYYTGDSSIFITIGKAMKEGKIVYKDIFDHKGPILFFIQMIGQYICDGRFGIFLLQILALFISNIFLYKSACFFTTNKKALLSILVSMIFMSYFIETGNYSEEYSLPFLSVCLYLAIKWLKSENKFSAKIYLYSFIYGVCFAIISFIRLNNSAMICGLGLAITIILIKEKKFKTLFGCACSVILGILAVSLPIILYFYSVNALYDMLYGTFIHNFLYVSANINTNMSINTRIMMAFILTVLVIFNCKKNFKLKYYSLIMIISYLSIILTVNIGIKTNHYYMISIPLIAIFMPPVIEIFCNKSMNFLLKSFIILYVCIIYTLGCFIPQLYHKINFENIGLEAINSFVNKNIEEQDKDSVLALGLFTAPIYLYADIFPCYKYAFMQDYLFYSNPDIAKETYDYIAENNIKYIFYINLDEVENKDEIQELILEKYIVKDSITLLEPNQLKIEPREVVLYELK